MQYTIPRNCRKLISNQINWLQEADPKQIQYNTIQYKTIQYSTIQYNTKITIQYDTIQYNTMQCNSIFQLPSAAPPPCRLCRLITVALHCFIFHWLFYQFWLAWSSIFSPFGSLWAQFWLHFGSILKVLGLPGPPLRHCGVPLGGRVSPRRSNERKAGSLDPPWASILESFMVIFLMKFLMICVYVFCMNFEAILEQIWEPEWIPNRLKIESKYD